MHWQINKTKSVDVHARGIASYPNIPPFHTNFKLTDDLSSLEEFEDTIGAIRIRISKKNRQHNGQKKKYKKTNNDLEWVFFFLSYITVGN
jgi:hypothetical protein